MWAQHLWYVPSVGCKQFNKDLWINWNWIPITGFKFYVMALGYMQFLGSRFCSQNSSNRCCFSEPIVTQWARPLIWLFVSMAYRLALLVAIFDAQDGDGEPFLTFSCQCPKHGPLRKWKRLHLFGALATSTPPFLQIGSKVGMAWGSRKLFEHSRNKETKKKEGVWLGLRAKSTQANFHMLRHG